MDGQQVPHSVDTVYLGITLDRKLHWQLHIKNKIIKAKKLLMAIAQATRNIWGPVPEVLRWAFIGIIRPVVTYACLIWGHETASAGIQKALLQLNRLALSIITMAHKSSPTKAMEVMTEMMPLPLHIKYTALNTYVRLHNKLPALDWEGSYSNKTYSTSHLKYWDTLVRGWDMLDLLTESDADDQQMPPLIEHPSLRLVVLHFLVKSPFTRTVAK